MLNIKPEIYDGLARKAAAQNQTVERLVEPVLEKLADDDRGATADQRLKAFEEWMALVQQRAGRYPQGHVVDDSRESIYEGRGE